jgi:hypothetical protein
VLVQKLKSLIQSRRFWLALSGILFVVTDHFGLPVSEDQVQTVIMLVAAWIIGDSLRATTTRASGGTASNICLLLCGLSVLIASTTFAQQIDTPSEIEAHRLVRSEATCEQSGGYAWIVRRLPDGFRPDLVRIDGGKAAIWTGPPGVYEIDLICQVDGALAQAHARVTIRGVGPGPTPPPGPDPPPEPGPSPIPDDIPDDVFDNLGQQVFASLQANAGETFPASELATLYFDTAKRLAGSQTPIIPTVAAASVVLTEGHDDLLQAENAAVWATCRIEIDRVWTKFEADMDRFKAAQFIAAVGNGLSAFDR